MSAEKPLPRAHASYIVVSTHAHREAFAIENLVRQGFEVYCPMLVRRVRHARKSQDVRRPLFAGYVFVAYEPARAAWRPILSTYCVRSVVRRGDAPALLDGAFVEALKAREIDGVICKPERPFAVDQRVAIQGGAFDGVVGQIVELRPNDRVVVLLDLLNGSARAQVSETDLREL